jgi:thioredoxin
MAVQLVSDTNFEQEVLQSEIPVLVDLYADWCAPCKQMEPLLEQLAGEFEGRLKVVRVDVERSPALKQGFRVKSIPMLVLIDEGRPVDQVVGAVDRNALLNLVRPVLSSAGNEVEPKELQEVLRQRRAVAVDIRDAGSFGRYRIPGAVNIPAEEATARSREFAPSDGRIRVLYARSTDAARELAEKLRSEGVEVAYLNGGFLHWEADGLEVEKG